MVALSPSSATLLDLTKGMNSTNTPWFALRPSGLEKCYPQRALRLTNLLKAVVVGTAPSHPQKRKGKSSGRSLTVGWAAPSAWLPRAGWDMLDEAVQCDRVSQMSGTTCLVLFCRFQVGLSRSTLSFQKTGETSTKFAVLIPFMQIAVAWECAILICYCFHLCFPKTCICRRFVQLKQFLNV